MSSLELHRVPFLDLHAQYAEIKDEIDGAIASVLRDTAFVGGAPVEDFEAAFAEFCGVGHCIPVANGTDALELILEALCLPERSEVIVPANSFIATSEAVSRSGHLVVFADIDPATYCLDPKDVAERITDRTGAVMAVHLYGHPAPMEALSRICSPRGIHIIEDAAQAHGARIGNRAAGSWGVAGSFSFYPGKNLGAYGDGGAVTTQNAALAQRVRMTANHGRTSKYAHEFEGRNSRLDGLQAAILSVKLKHLERWTERRRTLAGTYIKGLKGVGDLILPTEADGVRHVYHLFVVRTGERDRLREHLDAAGVASGIHYPIALPRLDAYSDHAQAGEPFRAVELADTLLSLPMGDSITEEHVERVVAAVRAFFEGTVA